MTNINNQDKKVNLFIIGVNKAGTSWLHFMLENHPKIYMSKLKEHYYFGRSYPEKLDEYHSYFPFDKPFDYFGESTHLYNQSKETALQIKSYCPNAKLFAIVRDPIQRLVSQYYFQKQTGIIKESSNLQDILADRSTPLIRESHYELSLPGFRDIFNEDQFKILSLEACRENLEESWTDIQHFLNLDNIPLPETTGKKENATGGRLFRMLYKSTIKPIKFNHPDLYKTLIQNPFMHWSKNQLLHILGTVEKEALPDELLNQLTIEFEPTYEYLCKIGYNDTYK